MNGMKKMKWISLMVVAALVCAMLAGCGPKETGGNPGGTTPPASSPAETAPSQQETTPAAADSYHLVGETLVQQTGADDSYRCGELDLNADGTAVFTLLNRTPDSDEKSVMYVWNQGTWSKNDDGSVAITFETLPEGGGLEKTDTGDHVVEAQISLEEGELLAALNDDGKLAVEVSLQVDLITFAIQQYTAIELVAE
ncbi:MAG: hypothetical protein K2P49_02480 [Oscillospiraceae bacterium]|nr:hypothetical protein [Oscillospiraceae bacterium]